MWAYFRHLLNAFENNELQPTLYVCHFTNFAFCNSRLAESSDISMNSEAGTSYFPDNTEESSRDKETSSACTSEQQESTSDIGQDTR